MGCPNCKSERNVELCLPFDVGSFHTDEAGVACVLACVECGTIFLGEGTRRTIEENLNHQEFVRKLVKEGKLK